MADHRAKLATAAPFPHVAIEGLVDAAFAHELPAACPAFERGNSERPAEERAPRHTTCYVNRQLPAHIDEDRTLSPGDVAEIKQLLEPCDSHIRMLYAQNTALRQAQDRGLTGHLPYLAKRAYVRFRRWGLPLHGARSSVAACASPTEPKA